MSSASESDRPETFNNRSGSRFGRLSRNMFFAREAAHPRLVHFFPGLNGSLVRVVEDVEVLMPANNNAWWNSWRQDAKGPVSARSPDLPIYAINWTNLSKMSKDTLNTLQYFTGLRNFSLKEQQSPKQLIGVVPVVQNWKNELNSFVDQIFSDEPAMAVAAAAAAAKPNETPSDLATQRKQLYSRKTGRLIEEKGLKRYGGQGNRTVRYPPVGKSLSTDDLPSIHGISREHEYVVLQMLSQLLQTDDPKAVGVWLASASDREKALAMELIRSVLQSRSEYFKFESSNTKNDTNAPETAKPLQTQNLAETVKTAKSEGKSRENGNSTLFTIDEDAEENPNRLARPAPPQHKPDVLNVDEERRLLASGGRKAAVGGPQRTRPPTQATSRSRSSQQNCPQCGQSGETWRPATSYVDSDSAKQDIVDY